MCFLTSWLVLWWGIDFHVSPYGLISGLLMVPGGTAGYFGVRNAGLAISQGIWSALKVLVAFGWGLFMFREPVRSVTGTAGAIACMLVGLLGMSYFASAGAVDEMLQEEEEESSTAYSPLLDADRVRSYSDGSLVHLEEEINHEDSPTTAVDMTPNHVYGLSWRSWGILGACIDGLYGGSVLVPMHFAKLKGLDFLLSFSIGCATVLAIVWVVRFTWLYVAMTKSASAAYQQLPSMHVSTIGGYATLAGLIWSIGNVSSILSVAYLGQGLGYSAVQCQLIVAGLWAVVWYGELQGARRITGWFACAIVTVTSILLLTRQHERVMAVEASSTDSGL